MTAADVAEIATIEQHATPTPWTSQMFLDALSKHYYCWVWESSNTILAYSVISLVVDEGEVLNFCVRPEKQRHGFGTSCFSEIMQKLQSLGCKTLFLEVRASNCPALALYRKMGFIEVGVRKQYYQLGDHREDATQMRLGL